MTHLQPSVLRSDSLSEEEKRQWEISDVEAEVRRGIMRMTSDSRKFLCIQRDISDFSNIRDMDVAEKETIGQYIELINESEKLEVNEAAQRSVAELRKDIMKEGVSIDSYVQPWIQGGFTEHTHPEYNQELGEAFYDRMTFDIETALSKQADVSSNAKEVATHLNFASQRSQSFYSRPDLVESGLNYLSSQTQEFPCVIHGDSGSGKTSTMAAIAVQTATFSPKPVLVLRFCGTTPQSGSLLTLLRGMIEQISSAYYSQPIHLPESVTDTIDVFVELLQLASEETPLIVIVDSLDQLSLEERGGESVSWIPTELPEHVHIVVSARSDSSGCYGDLRHRDIPEGNYLGVDTITREEAEEIATGSLATANRALQPKQLQKLLDLATDENAEPPTVLRLRLLLDMAMKVTSTDDFPDLASSVRGLIEGTLARIEQAHGERLVATVCGLLGVAPYGLGEETLQDLLAVDDEVLDDVRVSGQLPVRRLPQVRTQHIYSTTICCTKMYISLYYYLYY